MHFTQNLALVTLKMKMICRNNQNESTPINTQQNQIIHKITINPKMFLITGNFINVFVRLTSFFEFLLMITLHIIDLQYHIKQLILHN